MRALLLVLMLLTTPASAEVLGWRATHSNDSLGDQSDRWRSTSSEVSVLTGTAAALSFGDLIEWRARADIFTPASISDPAPGDRRFADVLSFGARTHWTRGGLEMSLGASVFFIGPQTGLDRIQEAIHDVLNFPQPQRAGFQIDDTIRVGLEGEVGQSIAVGRAQVRPFVAGAVGPETFARVGVDMALWSRDSGGPGLRQDTGGHRVAGLPGEPGWTLTLGGDLTSVRDSLYLEGVSVEPVRARVRAGISRTFGRGDIYYGMTWLSPEFEAQTEGQRVGTLSLHLKF